MIAETEFDAPMVLVVEDTPEFMEIFRTILDNLGYKLLTASDAVTACKLLDDRHEHIDLVVTDFDLGVGTGDEVAACARQYGVSPVFLVSGEPSRADSSLYDKMYHKTDTIRLFAKDMQELELPAKKNLDGGVVANGNSA